MNNPLIPDVTHDILEGIHDLQGNIVPTHQALHYFPNGYGASVIQGPYSYGGAQGLYELAVLKRSSTTIDSDGHDLCYDSPIADDVVGYLTEGDVADCLIKIAALPPIPLEDPNAPQD